MDSAGDSRKLWQTVSSLMDPPLTQTSSIAPFEFTAFFKGKLTTFAQQRHLPILHEARCGQPIVKKANFDLSLLTSCRPTSNLPFISKVPEHVVAHQLMSYLNLNQLMPRYQSAYRRNHSTETTLLKICSDALVAADSGMVALIVFFDMSAAVDTISQFGLTDAALDWHKSYLTGRTCRVVVNEAESDFMDLVCGLPHGLSPWPLKWIIYAAEL